MAKQSSAAPLGIIFKGDNADGNDKYKEELIRAGFRCHLVPVLSFYYCNAEMLMNILITPEKYSGIIFTSPRSVYAVRKAVENFNADQRYYLLEKWEKLLTFVVGEATQALAKTLLGLVPIGGHSGKADALSSVITSVVAPNKKPLLFPCGNLTNETIPKTLSEATIAVESIVVYQTQPNCCLRETLQYILFKEGKPDFMVYFSPSGVKYALPLLREIDFPIDKCKFIAIGTSTGDAMVKMGLEVAAIAMHPTPEYLAQAIMNL
uniref:Uroporphyrinogen-III synthase n=1 Tax=Strigamia maritima TaxID=126957 RepID=T1JH56_STRMM